MTGRTRTCDSKQDIQRIGPPSPVQPTRDAHWPSSGRFLTERQPTKALSTPVLKPLSDSCCSFCSSSKRRDESAYSSNLSRQRKREATDQHGPRSQEEHKNMPSTSLPHRVLSRPRITRWSNSSTEHEHNHGEHHRATTTRKCTCTGVNVEPMSADVSLQMARSCHELQTALNAKRPRELRPSFAVNGTNRMFGRSGASSEIVARSDGFHMDNLMSVWPAFHQQQY